MEIDLKNICKTFANLKEMMWETVDIILLAAQFELEEAGYLLSHKFTGEANEALSASLSEDDGSQIPEIYVFLPDARLIPPDPESSLIIDINWYTKKDKVKMVTDIFIRYDSRALTEHAQFIADTISNIIRPQV